MTGSPLRALQLYADGRRIRWWPALWLLVAVFVARGSSSGVDVPFTSLPTTVAVGFAELLLVMALVTTGWLLASRMSTWELLRRRFVQIAPVTVVAISNLLAVIVLWAAIRVEFAMPDRWALIDELTKSTYTPTSLFVALSPMLSNALIVGNLTLALIPLLGRAYGTLSGLVLYLGCLVAATTRGTSTLVPYRIIRDASAELAWPVAYRPLWGVCALTLMLAMASWYRYGSGPARFSRDDA